MPLMVTATGFSLLIPPTPCKAHRAWKTVETNSDQIDVVQYVSKSTVNAPSTCGPTYIWMRVAFVPDEDSPARLPIAAGSRKFSQLSHRTRSSRQDHCRHPCNRQPVSCAGAQEQNMTIPYSSVFIRLDCKYWGQTPRSACAKKLAQPRRRRALSLLTHVCNRNKLPRGTD